MLTPIKSEKVYKIITSNLKYVIFYKVVKMNIRKIK